MGVQYLEEGFDDFRKLVIELLVHPRRQERERLDQALGVRVFAVVALDQQPRSDLRVLRSKLLAEKAQVRQFLFVVGQQFVEHQLRFCTLYSWVLTCSTASNDTWRLMSCRRNTASTRKVNMRWPFCWANS